MLVLESPLELPYSVIMWRREILANSKSPRIGGEILTFKSQDTKMVRKYKYWRMAVDSQYFPPLHNCAIHISVT